MRGATPIMPSDMEKTTIKTNAVWYPYVDLGTYFKLEKGILMGCPMNVDGTRDDTAFDIDWERGLKDDEQERMKQIVSELKKAN